MGSRWRVWARRIVVVVVVVAQLTFVVRGYSLRHKEFAFQMFPESSTWQADVVRVTADGRASRSPIRGTGTAGHSWCGRAACVPGVRHHADAGLDNQLAFLDAALD